MSNPAECTIADWRKFKAAEQKAATKTVHDFVAAAANRDWSAFRTAFLECDVKGTLARAFRAVGRLGLIPSPLNTDMVEWWRRDGDSLRSSVMDDRALVAGLRALMPRYEGADVVLYRGQNDPGPRRRNLGLCWSAKQAVADEFARGRLPMLQGGSCVIQAFAPAEAILFALSPHFQQDEYGEAEYVVDPRRLRQVRVISRYSKISMDDIDVSGVVFIAENGGGAAVRLANPGADHADKFGYASAAGLTVHPPAGEDDE
jgi:hypothetical protein